MRVGAHYSPAQVEARLAADIAHVTAGLDKAQLAQPAPPVPKAA